MGKASTTSAEMAQTVVSSAFVATGFSASAQFMGDFNFSVQGVFVGTVVLLVSYDGGANFIPLQSVPGTGYSFTAPGMVRLTNTEPGLLYEMQCSAFTSGTLNARLAAGASRGRDERLT